MPKLDASLSSSTLFFHLLIVSFLGSFQCHMDYLDQDLGQSLMVSHQDPRICSTSLLEGQGQCLVSRGKLSLRWYMQLPLRWV